MARSSAKTAREGAELKCLLLIAEIGAFASSIRIVPI
jgi:hypothetical protein